MHYCTPALLALYAGNKPATVFMEKLHMFRQVNLPAETQGKLYLHSMPGRHEAFPSFIAEARRISLDTVICLTMEDEIRDKSPQYFEARARQQLPFSVRDFPIKDFNAPGDSEKSAFKEFVMERVAELRAGQALLVHCKMGIGRTGTVTVCLLLELGMGLAEAISIVESAGSYPMVVEQDRFIDWYASTLVS